MLLNEYIGELRIITILSLFVTIGFYSSMAYVKYCRATVALLIASLFASMLASGDLLIASVSVVILLSLPALLEPIAWLTEIVTKKRAENNYGPTGIDITFSWSTVYKSF